MNFLMPTNALNFCIDENTHNVCSDRMNTPVGYQIAMRARRYRSGNIVPVTKESNFIAFPVKHLLPQRHESPSRLLVVVEDSERVPALTEGLFSRTVEDMNDGA